MSVNYCTPSALNRRFWPFLTVLDAKSGRNDRYFWSQAPTPGALNCQVSLIVTFGNLVLYIEGLESKVRGICTLFSVRKSTLFWRFPSVASKPLTHCSTLGISHVRNFMFFDPLFWTSGF